MSKKDKLLLRLIGPPAPKDFPWSDLLTVMGHCGFAHRCSGGSHFTFEHHSGFRFTVSSTHPGGILKAYQVRDVLEALTMVGALNGEARNG
jgi:predicted RNA binding protein YcfA (HicA-like mRNA interferase family)